MWSSGLIWTLSLIHICTPDFAVASLRRLVADGHEVCGVFTQPDKPKNRGHKLVPTPVKEFALTENIPVYQPLKMRDGTALELVQSLAPELTVVAAYGRILPEEMCIRDRRLPGWRTRCGGGCWSRCSTTWAGGCI